MDIIANALRPGSEPQPDLSEIELLRSKILSTANRLNSVLNENGLRDQSLQPSRGRGGYRRDMSVDAVLRQLDDTFPSLPTSPCSIPEEVVEPEFSSDLPSVADCLADKLADIKSFSRTTSRERARMGRKDPPLEAADAAMQHCIGVLDVFARRERHRAEVLNGIFEDVAKLVYPVDTSARSLAKSKVRRSEHVRVDSAHGECSRDDQPFDARHREQMESAATLYTEDRKQWVGDLLRCIEQLQSVKSTNLLEDSSDEEEESGAESGEEEDEDSDCDSSDSDE